VTAYGNKYSTNSVLNTWSDRKTLTN